MNPPSVSAQSRPADTASTTIRALVIAADARFQQRAESVIGEVAGVAFALAAPTNADDVWWLVRHERADVVVLDATACEARVGRVIAALSALDPRLGVVVVCEHLTPGARELGALPKWGWKRELRAAVLRAQIDGSPLARPAGLPRSGHSELRGAAPAVIGRR